MPTRNPLVAFQEIPEYHPPNTEQNPSNPLPTPTIEVSMAAKQTKGQTTLFKPAVPRDPEILDVQTTADMMGISKDAVYDLFRKGELPGRKVARRWLTTRDAVLKWLKGSSEEDTLARAIANGDQKAITAALKSGKVQVKKRK
jgi:excisionase family DNA binding protein